MNLQIGEDYRVVSDSNNLILLRKRVSDPNHHFSSGVPRVSWEVEGYYGRYEHLVNHLVEKEIRMSDATTLEELVKKVEKTKAVIVNKVNEAIGYDEEQVEEESVEEE